MFNYKKEFKNLLHLLTYGILIFIFAPIGFFLANSFQETLYSFQFGVELNAIIAVIFTILVLVIDTVIGIAENVFIWSKLFDENLSKLTISPISLGLGAGWLAGLI